MAGSCSPEIFRNALDHIPDAVLISDAAGAVRFANRRVAQLLGYDVEEILGRDVERLLPERFRRAHIGQRDRFTAAGGDRPMGSGSTLAALRKDGSELPVQISLGSIEDAEGTFVVAAIRDVAAHQQLCEALSLAQETAARAERAAREALVSARGASAARWTSASYLLRQELHALSLLNGLLADREMLSQAALTRALSGQAEAIVTMMNLLEFLIDQSELQSRTGAEVTETSDETMARPVERLGREASRRRVTPASVPVARPAPTVLIVLRDRGMREAAAGLLRICGYPVLGAGNVPQARRLACLHPEVGVVLTEQTLEGPDTGWDAIDALRSTLGAHLKAILISDDPASARRRSPDPSERLRIARMPMQADELIATLDELRRDGAHWSGDIP